MAITHLTSLAMERRDFLRRAGAGAIAISVVPFDAGATPQGTQQAIEDIIGSRPVKIDDRVKLMLPEIAENGGTVPLSVVVDSPMTEKDHIVAMHIFCDGNPSPDMASYFLGPQNGKAEIAMRIRLMQTQNIVVLAETNSGDVWRNQSQVKVTLGGCGG